ncbi:MAG TPA: hypoxanthine phosphoribosyltransferase [Bacteroidota bacterium]|nr:hypoxanthine phosphoribosyltransferase [Bacteroidota bacterium]
MIPLQSIPDTVTIRGDVFVPFISAERLHERIAALADSISTEYEGRSPVFVCVLNGAFMFFADLVRQVRIDCEVDFIKLSSYGETKISSGRVRLDKDMNCEIAGRHVLLVEDIVDTGYSIDYMKKLIAAKNPASMKIVTLLHKPASTKIEHELHYVGFEIPPRFVVGYGLDYAQQARNLPAIYILDGDGTHE